MNDKTRGWPDRGRMLLLVLLACIFLTGAEFVDIIPNDGAGGIQIKAGQTVKFEAKPGNSTGSGDIPANMTVLRWDYHRLIFQKVSSADTSITLKAQREGAGFVSVMTKINNSPCYKRINATVYK